MNTLTKIDAFSTISLMVVIALIGFMTGTASAQDGSDVLRGVDAAGGPGGNAETEVNNLVGNVISILSWVVGVIAVIMIIVSGLRFILAGGDAQKVGQARNGIIYGLVGLAVVVMAQAIVRFVINEATGTPGAVEAVDPAAG
ncbi:MAG: pilin [Patescibacteria group bacterium]